MTDSDIHRDIVGAIEAIGRMGSAQAALNESFTNEISRVWDDNAAIRDDLHALANRLEALTNFVVSDPAEVAAKIVNDANRATLKEVRNDD
jgi:uncharacterized protein YfcZ (UPF0381/DUF406 family)